MAPLHRADKDRRISEQQAVEIGHWDGVGNDVTTILLALVVSCKFPIVLVFISKLILMIWLS